MSPRTLVIALGGNAIARKGDDGTVAAQYERTAEALRPLTRLACRGERIVLTHGNGPVVGNIVLRGELARATVPPTPLFIADADSEGGIGLMLQQVLGNQLREAGSPCVPATVITQVVVDADDPAFLAPTKPIGPYYTQAEAAEVSAAYGWSVTEEAGGGWRRVVASPRPIRVVETPAIVALLDAGVVPIAAGGGGVPVVSAPDGSFMGIDAVIDKDWASAILARELDADALVILMEADAIYEDWGTPAAHRIEHLSAAAGTALAAALPKGSAAPKLAAASWFASTGGTAVICRAEDLDDALTGHAGTTVTRD